MSGGETTIEQATVSENRSDSTTLETTEPRSRWGYLPQIVCIGLPPCFFLALRSLPVFVRDPVRDSFAAGIILVWQLAMVYRMIRTRRARTTRSLENAFTAAVVQQTIIIVLASLVLDVGQCFSYACLAGMAYWMIAGLILSGRPATPTEFDLDVIRGAPFLLLIPIGMAGMSIEMSQREATEALLRSLLGS